MTLLSYDQQIRLITYAPCITGSLSLLGSLLTVLTLYRTRKAGSKLQTYHRLMLGLSVSDVLFSLGTSLGPSALPSDWEWIGASGTTATCTFQGFLLTLGHASFVYNTSLMIYYLLVIRYSVREEKIAKRVEPFMHFIAIAFHLAIAVAGLALEIFNPIWGYCWYAPYPYYCVDDPDEEAGEVPCERGGEFAWRIFDEWFITIPVLAQAAFMLLILIVVALTVWSRFRKTQKFSFEHKVRASHNPQPRKNNRNKNTLSASQAMEQRARRVILQCFLYAFCFINVTLWSNIATLAEMAGDGGLYDRNFWMAALAFIFLPAQGFFNFFIYIRPRYLTVRQECPHSYRWFALKEAVWYPVAKPSERASRFGSTCANSVLQRGAAVIIQETNQPNAPPTDSPTQHTPAADETQEISEATTNGDFVEPQHVVYKSSDLFVEMETLTNIDEEDSKEVLDTVAEGNAQEQDTPPQQQQLL